MSSCLCAALAIFLLSACLVRERPLHRPADRVYRNGVIFTADARNGTAEALAIRDGRIVYVGSNQGLAPFVGAATVSVDLKGKFLMPGLVDGHMHPLEAGRQLLKCSLNYESLTIAELQQRVQACLDHDASNDPDAWLEVVSWFQESMRPAGVKTSRATLDVLKTDPADYRPLLFRTHGPGQHARVWPWPKSRPALPIRSAERSGTTPAANRRACSKMRRTKCSPTCCRSRRRSKTWRPRKPRSRP